MLLQDHNQIKKIINCQQEQIINKLTHTELILQIQHLIKKDQKIIIDQLHKILIGQEEKK